MRGQDASEAHQEAEKERGYYTRLIELKKLVAESHYVLDASTGIIQWNEEAKALLAAMPKEDSDSLHQSVTQ